MHDPTKTRGTASGNYCANMSISLLPGADAGPAVAVANTEGISGADRL